MPKYRASATVTISVHKIIEAENRQAAYEIAESLSVPDLCHACAVAGKGDENSWQLSGELDGEPQEIEVEER